MQISKPGPKGGKLLIREHRPKEQPVADAQPAVPAQAPSAAPHCKHSAKFSAATEQKQIVVRTTIMLRGHDASAGGGCPSRVLALAALFCVLYACISSRLEGVLQKKGVHRPMQQYRNPDLWLLDATTTKSATAIRVSDEDHRRFEIDPLPQRPWAQQRPRRSSRSLHQHYSTLYHHNKLPHQLLGPLSQEQNLGSGDTHREQPTATNTPAESTARPASALAARSMGRLRSLQNRRRQQSAHR